MNHEFESVLLNNDTIVNIKITQLKEIKNNALNSAALG